MYVEHPPIVLTGCGLHKCIFLKLWTVYYVHFELPYRDFKLDKYMYVLKECTGGIHDDDPCVLRNM